MYINIIEKYNKYKNTLVLNYFQVYRFIEIVSDEDDFYFFFDDGTNYQKMSILLTFIPLVESLKKEDYNELVRIWNLNNNSKIESI
jgi:hypothetical protein